jgi:fermentation-respiration switch protein FrsA (DUF1100 family)
MNERNRVNRGTFLAAAAAGATSAFIPRVARATEEDIALPTPTGRIAGTLVIPSKMPPPVVLVIAGSGPVDRDGNTTGVLSNEYGLLADALAQRGIGSLRYDKRGVGASAGAAIAEQDLRLETLVDDAVAWIRWLRADGRLSKIVVAGHSEGSLIGMLAIQKTGANAFVSLEGAGRPAAVVLREQLKRSATPEIYAEAEPILAQLEQGKTVSDPPSELASLFRESVQPYLISWFKHDPAVEIAKIKAPTTIVQGTADVQVTLDDARALSRAKPDARLVIVDGMNHVLKYAPDTSSQAAIAKGYEDASLPVDPHAVDAIYKASS